jgi:hypothetical protein
VVTRLDLEHARAVRRLASCLVAQFDQTFSEFGCLDVDSRKQQVGVAVYLRSDLPTVPAKPIANLVFELA